MSQYQLSFDEMPEVQRWRPRDREGLFLAIFPDDKAAGEALRIGESFVRENGLVKPLHRADRLHVSLCGIRKASRLRTTDVFGARRAAEKVSMPPFDVTFDRIVSWKAESPDGRRNPLVLIGGGVELLQFIEALVDCLRREGLKCGVATPHMTLVYDRRLIAEQPISPLRWTVREFVLVHSERGLTNYIFKGRWPLGA